MDKTTVFTKTAKGITQVNQRSASLSKDLMKILKLVDGKSTFGQILEKAELDKAVLEKAMNTLIKDGFARIFETRKEPDPFGEDDFDFTAPGKLPGQTQRVVAAAALDISERTVKTHLGHLFEKLGVTSRTEAVKIATRRGLVRLE